MFERYRSRRGSLTAGLMLAAFAFLSYYSSQEFNPVTGETQYVALAPEQEVALGLQAAPVLTGEHGGLSADRAATRRVKEMGARIAAIPSLRDAKWPYAFHLLADTETVNAFALPGGQIFITHGLYDLLQSDEQLAAVLAHEIGHVVARHGAEHLAKQRLTQGLTGAAVVASGDHSAGYVAAMVGQLVNLRYGRGDEIESDRLGVRFMKEAGLDPQAMVEVMRILTKAAKGPRPPEFFSSHPNPENRIGKIEEAIGAQLTPKKVRNY